MIFWTFEPSHLLKVYGYQAAVEQGETIAATTSLQSKYMTYANGKTFLSAIRPRIYVDGNCEIKADAENPRIKDDSDL